MFIMNFILAKWAELRSILKDIRSMFMLWDISFEEANNMANPYIEEINRRWKEISKEHGKNRKPITFANTCR